MTPTSLPLASIRPSSTNPRQNFDAAKLEELAASVKEHGVLQPVLVRADGKRYELVAGERRLRAAQMAGLEEIPAIVREYTDVQVLEIQVIENLQRDDLHPLEEADGYLKLSKMKGYDVAKIAARIGRSVKYVYDRMKLVSLVKEAREIFLAGRVTPGHAILLARLKPGDQTRAIDPNEARERYGRTGGGLWETEGFFSDADRSDKYHGLKPVSVRELAAWIDQHVRLEPPDVDQMILPETAEALQEAAEKSVKVLRITPDIMTPAAGKTGPKLILGRSWERADGKQKSKTCEHSRLGMIEVGEGRGEAFAVCVAKKICSVHWKESVQSARRAKNAVRKAVAKGVDPEVAREKARIIEQRRRAEDEARWKKAQPDLEDAFVEAIQKAPAGAAGALGKIVLESFEDSVSGVALRKVAKLVPPGRSAEDLVRHMAGALVLFDLEDLWSHERLIANGHALGVDVKGILDAAAPEKEPAKKEPPRRERPAAKRAARKGK